MAPLALFDLLAGIASLSLVYYIYEVKGKTKLPLPPGPKGYPVIGNLFDLSTKIWIKFDAWSKELGSDIIYLNVLGQSIVVLNSWETTTDLLEKRSSIYSDRPRLAMALELMGFHFVLPLIKYGSQWRSQRRLMHNVFHPTAAKNFRPHSLKAARGVLRRFLDKPGDVDGNIRHTAGETIVTIAYGLDIKPENDPYLKSAEETLHILDDTVTLGSNLVDFFPILKYIPEWMPGAGFHAKAREARKVANKLVEEPFKAAKARIDSGDYVPSFVSFSYSAVANESSDPTWNEYILKGTAATMYLAGSDTTSSTIVYCVAFLANNPDLLKRAHEEMDSVVPFGELPSFDDFEKLPFITAICMETMRLKELLPLALPHVLVEDDVYKGYRLPKGSIVFGNAWAMLHNEAVYPEPFSFKPDRFMKDGKINKDVRDPSHAAFGFGRRYMAFPSVWITVASIVAAFDIDKAKDASGAIIDVDVSDNDCKGMLRFPLPFTCSVKSRSTKHEQTIRETKDEEYWKLEKAFEFEEESR